MKKPSIGSDLELMNILKHIYTRKSAKNSSMRPNASNFSELVIPSEPNNSNRQSKKFIKVKRKVINQPKSRQAPSTGETPKQSLSKMNNASMPRLTTSQQFPQRRGNDFNLNPNEKAFDLSFKCNQSQLCYPQSYQPNASVSKLISPSDSFYQTGCSMKLSGSNYFQQQHQQQQQQQQLYRRKKYTDNFIDKIRHSNNKDSRVSNAIEVIVDPEEIILLEEKVSNIQLFLSKGKKASIPCCDWWSFYIASSLLKHQTAFFVEDSSKIIVYSASNVMMLAVILCYDLSDEEQLYSQLNLLFKTIFTLLQLNSLLLFKFILGKLSHENRLICEFDEYLLEKINGEARVELDEANMCNMLKHNCTSIVDLTRLILNNYNQSILFDTLMFYFTNISKVTPKELNAFFINCVYQPEKHRTRSLTARVSPNDFLEITKVSPPFLPPKDDKRPYTLILDLDETLISFERTKDNRGLLLLRPGLIEFLSVVREYYELVLFTTATKEYADPIANEIERSQKFFDFKLYRSHSVLVDNDRVKDLTKIGRDLSRVVIVDNLADNYKLQRENGILIQPFYGENSNDSSLSQLTLFLIKIAKEANESPEPDLRVLLLKYHTEVTTHVSSNLHRFKDKIQSEPIVLNMKEKQKTPQSKGDSALAFN